MGIHSPVFGYYGLLYQSSDCFAMTPFFDTLTRDAASRKTEHLCATAISDLKSQRKSAV